MNVANTLHLAPIEKNSVLTQIDMYASKRRQNAKLIIEKVSKHYGAGATAVTALSDVSLAIKKKDFICIVGPSGCGKSTLLNAIAGFETTSEGYIFLDGKEVNSPGAERGVVFQQGALFDWMTVRENIEFGPRSTGLPKHERENTVNKYLKMVGLDSFDKSYPHQLSGGMQQRVGIARALANDPEILLMDEPFAALDQQTKETLQSELKNIWKTTSKTIIWITHSIEEALFLGTHVIVMSSRPGKIKASFEVNFDVPDEQLLNDDSFFKAKRDIFYLLHNDESVK